MAETTSNDKSISSSPLTANITSMSQNPLSIQNKDNFNKLRMMALTFNMGNARIDNLNNLIPDNGANLDIIALGFQESIYSGKQKEDDDENKASKSDNDKVSGTEDNKNTNINTVDDPNKVAQTSSSSSEPSTPASPTSPTSPTAAAASSSSTDSSNKNTIQDKVTSGINSSLEKMSKLGISKKSLVAITDKIAIIEDQSAFVKGIAAMLGNEFILVSEDDMMEYCPCSSNLPPTYSECYEAD